MSDLRATERLLEVISEREGSIRKAIAPDGSASNARAHSDALDIKEAVTELRRRGDTLVRRDDLIAVLAGVERGSLKGITVRGVDATAAWERLEQAIGGEF